MEQMEGVIRDLKLQEAQCRTLSANRVLALVHDDWLKSLKVKGKGSVSAPTHPDVPVDKLQGLIAPSCHSIPKPWSRITIKVIRKQELQLMCPIIHHKPPVDPKMGFIELMSTLCKEHYKNSWAESHQRYNHQIKGERRGTQEKSFNDAVRDSLGALFHCQPLSLSRQLSGPSHQSFTPKILDCPNILQAIALLESESAFYVIQPYITYTLNDLVTFSPAILEKSYAKPLFILYQVLQLMKACFECGQPVREFGLHDLLVDDKLWVSVSLPSLRTIRQLCPPIPKETSKTESNALETEGNKNLSPEFPLCDHIPDLVQNWVNGGLSNYQYLMTLNRLVGRRMGDPNHYPVLPWVMDFTCPGGTLRDLTMSKYRLNKGDKQLDITYDMDPLIPSSGDGIAHIPHHISDVLSDITYYVYKARRTSKDILCMHVRKNWVPHEYPPNMVRMYAWTPDECIPEFFTDASIFESIHDDLPNLEIPNWCSSPDDFIRCHMKVLESDEVSEKLHHWIDLTFGYKLSGPSAVKAKNVCLQLVDQHTDLVNHGVVQLFTSPHPKRVCNPKFISKEAPLFQRKPSIMQDGDKLKKDLESLTAALQVFGEASADKDISTSDIRQRSGTLDYEQIILPEKYNPLALLERVESLYEYSSKAMFKLPSPEPVKVAPKEDTFEKVMTCHMQAFGCLMVEVFMAQKLRMTNQGASLKQRYQVIRSLCQRDWKDVPRPIRQAVHYLLEPQRDWNPDDCPDDGPLFSYTSFSFNSLPSPTPELLLHPIISPIPFPPYFDDLYDILQRLRKEDEKIAQIVESEMSAMGKNLQVLPMHREKVYIMSDYLVQTLDHCGSEGIELILSYVREMFENLDTTVPAAWALFNHISRALGRKETANQLLPALIRLFSGEYATEKHLKLYHRAFLKQLVIRLGLQTFLAHFSTLLIEAVAGYKDFPIGNEITGAEFPGQDQVEGLISPRTAISKLSTASIEVELQRQLIEAHSKVRRSDTNRLDILQEVVEKSDNLPPTVPPTVVSVNADSSPESCEYDLDDNLTDNILLEAESMRPISPTDRERNLSDAGSIGECSLDRLDTGVQERASNSSNEEKCRDEEESDLSDSALSQSLGRLSVHSVSRLIDSSRERHRSGSIGSLDGDFSERRESSVFDDDFDEDALDLPVPGMEATEEQNSLLLRENGENSDADGGEDDEVDGADEMTAFRIVRSETEEFTASLMESTKVLGCNICDVSAESVKWFSHKLGPLLTAKFLSRNLLRMLSLCYVGEEQLVFVQVDDDPLSASHRRVVGDSNASRILDCLSTIAVLYGEQVIMLQYLPHAVEMVSIAQRKLNSRSEAGLIGVLSLLRHILPYLSDTTLMDNLEDIVFHDIMLPLLRLASSCRDSFPSAGHARAVICYKFIDVLHLVGLRIGFEMTRHYMTPMLMRFFASFDRVYSYQRRSSDAEENDTPTTKVEPELAQEPVSDLLEDNVFCEIKMDSKTKEYKIGTPVYLDQFSSSCKYSLSPPVHEERGLEEDQANTSIVDPRDRIREELVSCFTPELAHTAYIPFCKLAGGIHMEQNLHNDDLIRRLCTCHDEALSKQQVQMQENFSDDESSCAGTPTTTNWFVDWGTPVEKVTFNPDVSSEPEELVSSGNFGQNVALEGNRITVQETPSPSEEKDTPETTPTHKMVELPSIDPAQLKSPEMEKNKGRHLKGNWLAYWEHELGLNEKGSTFNFKQIKLQTFTGHTNSVRSIYSMDNENCFITASKDKTVKLWTIRSCGDGSAKSGCQWTYPSHKKSVFAVTFLESVRVVASCDSTVHLWDPFVGMNIKQFETSRNAPVTVLSPMPAPSATLLTATTDATLRFLDVRMGAYAQEFKCTMGQAGLIRCVTVSPNSNWVAIGYSSGIISILDIRTGLLLGTWKGHEGEILQIKAYNTSSFITSSFDHTMSLWGTDDGKVICNFKGQSEPVHCFNFYKDELISATTGNRVGVYTSVNSQASFSSTKLRTDTFRGVLTTMNVLPMNRLLLLGADSGTVRLLC